MILVLYDSDVLLENVDLSPIIKTKANIVDIFWACKILVMAFSC